jgi:hypothetical protein
MVRKLGHCFGKAEMPSKDKPSDSVPQWRLLRGRMGEPSSSVNFIQILILKHKKSYPFFWKHYLQIRSTVVSAALCRVAPWGSQRTASFRPPLGTLTSIQNLGGSWFSPPSIDSHSNYDHVRRTFSSLSELFQHELTCCPPKGSDN